MLLLIVVTSFFALSSCGTILKSYQINKPHTNQLDLTVVILDSVGLLFFLLPGIIAFAVDYSTGTLYLPLSTPN